MVDMTYLQTLKRLLSVFTLVGASVLIPTSIALAHTDIVSTSPAANTDVNVSQESISITLSEPPLIDGAAIVVMNEAGDILDSPAPALAGATLTIPWPTDLTPGEVLVTWRATAADGHVVSNEFRFKYTAAAESGVAGTETPEPMMSALDTPDTTALPLGDGQVSGSNNTLTIVAISALAGLIAVGPYLRRGR
jgi:methionine-rich copper-binding protein CopC